MVRQTANCGRVRTRIVIDDDDHLTLTRGDIVQRLPSHSTGQCAIADNRYHMVVPKKPALLPSLGEPIGV